MKEELREIMAKETKAVEILLEALDNQHNALIKSDAIVLENCVSQIESSNKELAAWEMKRREVTKGRAVGDIIDELADEELEASYRKIKILLEETKVQKETNELLIKQGLSFTNRILSILSPSRAPKTYNSYGKIAR